MITTGFMIGLRTCWLWSTRWPAYYDNTMTFRAMDDLVESAITARLAIDNGALNPARRELRFVLGSAINHLYVDERLLRGVSLEIKLTSPRTKNIDTVKAANAIDLSIGALYGRLSQVVHPSPAQFRVRLARSAQGNYLGFESLDELREITDLQLEVYDIALACVFRSLEPMTGEVFIEVLDDLLWWPFHHTPHCYRMSAMFNYKAERQNRRGGPVRDRVLELLRVIEARKQLLTAQPLP
jgi:hypothetical protein